MDATANPMDATANPMDATANPMDATATSTEEASNATHATTRDSVGQRVPTRRVLALVVTVAALVVLPGTARGHGTAGAGGTPVGAAVVVALPALAGLAGGAAAARYWRSDGPTASHRGRVTPGAVLVVLGVTLALSAVARHPSLGAVGVAGGVAVALLATGRSGSPDHPSGHHAGLALGAVCGHRAVEGVVVGAFYAAGGAVGLVAAAVVAGHTAVETAVAAGVAGPSRSRAAAATVVVQVGYVAGAAVGLGVASALAAPVGTVALALAGGVLVAVGARETGHATPVVRLATRP